MWLLVLTSSDCVFRPLHRTDASPPGSASPGRSSGTASPVSAQARREKDRKHLDDVCAARLPPLHHSPARLLSLEESADLVREQVKKQQVSAAGRVPLAPSVLQPGPGILSCSFVFRKC